MQNPYPLNGYAPPTNGVSSHAEASGDHGSDGHGWIQTPTVAAALPFAPFSSIVPFNPGRRTSNLWHVMTICRMPICQARCDFC
jgi:hypothetical protein